MANLTRQEQEELAGILDQLELDIRTEVREIDPLHGPRMVAKWTEELEMKAARVRELSVKLKGDEDDEG